MKVITVMDPEERNTILYSVDIDKVDKNSVSNLKLERLKEESQILGDKTRKSFYISNDRDKQIILLSIMKNQVFVNVAILTNGILKLASVSKKVSFIEVEEKETIEIYYTPTFERKIFVIDLTTGNEVEPEFNITSTGIMKGIVNLKIGKKYLVLELRDLGVRTMMIGASQLLLDEDVLKLNISKEEVKVINIDNYIKLINSGKCIEQKLKDGNEKRKDNYEK